MDPLDMGDPPFASRVSSLRRPARQCASAPGHKGRKPVPTRLLEVWEAGEDRFASEPLPARATCSRPEVGEAGDKQAGDRRGSLRFTHLRSPRDLIADQPIGGRGRGWSVTPP